MRIFTALIASGAILAAGLFSSSADAAFQVTLTDSTTLSTLTIVDVDNDGIISFENVVLTGGTYVFTGALAFDNAATATNVGFVFSGFSIKNTVGKIASVNDVVSVYANSSEFYNPSTPPELYGGVTGSVNATIGGSTTTASLYIDDVDPRVSTSPQGDLVATDTITVTANPLPDSKTFFDKQIVGLVDTPYALNLLVSTKITKVTGGKVSINYDVSGSVTNVPEPTALAIWGLFGLTAVGGGAWRRRRAAQKS